MKKIILLILMSFISFLGYSQQEDFEGAPATPDAAGVWALPTSAGQGLGTWLVRDNRTNSNPNWRVNPPALPVHSGTQAAYIDRENTGPGVLSEEWLITPQITVPTNGQLRFFTTQTIAGQTNPGTLYQIRVSSSATQGDLGSYTILKEYTETELSTETPDQLDYEEKAIDLTFSGPRYFAFVKVFTQAGPATSGDRWLVDDVRWIQRCDAPIAPLGILNLTGTGVTLSWTMPAGSTQTQYEIQYGNSGFVVGNGTSVLATTGTANPRTKAITGLTEGTDYQFYVRAVCADSNSTWTGPFNFSTPPAGSTCAAPIIVPSIPYSNTSDTALYGNNVTAGSPGTSGCGTTGAFLAGNDVVYSYMATTTGFLNITMNPTGNTNTGIFVYNSCATIGTSCIAGVGNSNSNIRTIPALSVTAGNTYYIVISSTTATPTFPYTLIIQQVTCPNPINGTAGSIGTDSATLSWANGTGGTATEFEVAVQPVGSAIPSGAGTPATGLSLLVNTGLTAATSYQYWVRADCGGGLFSIWSGPFFFNTSICNVVEQCDYTFIMTDTGNNGWNGATMQVRQNGIVVATIGNTFTGGGGPITATIGMCDGVPFDLYWNAGGTNAAQCRVTIKNSFGQTLYAMTTASAALVGTSLYQGNVNCQDPLCQAPTAVLVPTATINPNGATVNWTTSGDPTFGWGIYWVVAGGSPPIQGQTPLDTVLIPLPPSYTITGLNPDTDYDVYVTSLCTVNSPSTWTPVTTFHTTPTCPKPTGVTISAVTNLSFNVNWTNVGAGTSWQVLVLPSPSSLPLPTTGWLDASTTSLLIDATNYPAIAASTKYDVYVRALCPGNDVGQPQAPVIVETKVCDPIDACNYIFTISDSFGDSWNGAIIEVRQNGIVVATITGPTNAQGTNPVQITVPLCSGVPFDLNWSVAGTFPNEVRISVTNSFGQVLYNMNTASGNLAGTVIYSDGADCDFPKCLPVTGVTVTTTITAATLTWTPAGNNTGWDIFVIAAPGTINDASVPTYTNVPVTGPPYTFTTTIPLSPDTAYNFYVRGTCAVGNPSNPSVVVPATTLPTCPQPINLNYVGTFPDHGEVYWQEVGPATSWHIVVQQSGGAAPTTNGAGCLVTTLPTAATPYNTNSCIPGGLTPGFWEFYVQSDCTSSDISHWSGPYNFFVTPGQVVCADVDYGPDTTSEIDFCPGTHCVDLSATFVDSKETTSYSVLPVAFAPPFPFTGGTQLNIATDDIWGPVFQLPFNFCFFGTNYPAVQVGSNGVISFTTTYPPNQGGGCPWNTDPGVTVPNTAFPILNAIYGVYQDILPSTATPSASINYQVLGVAPCRTFVVNYLNIEQFDCGADVGLQTSQIVLYETSNIIEVYVQDRTSCTDWNEGSGVIGIQNAAGTVGYTPPGRNLGPWEAHNEAWRFTPNGASNVAFSWLQGSNVYSTDTNINVCVSETTTMTAQAVYTGCGGQITTKTKTVLLKINDIDVLPVDNVVTCGCYTLPALAVGNYFSQPNGVDPITNLQICSTQTIYIYAQSNTIPVCSDEESFTVTIESTLIPTFDPIANVCIGTVPPLLPLTSTNGITGTWIPATIDTSVSGTTVYTFTPDGVIACAVPTTLSVTIDPGVVPVFDPIGDICLNATAPLLPLTSVDGVTGTWSPATIDTSLGGTVCYTFTPDGAIPCTGTATLCVTISTQIVPTFTQIANICQDTSAPALPLISNNGVNGTWVPATIDTSVSGTFVYVFTPNLTELCAIPATMTVTVDPSQTPTFATILDMCQNYPTPPVLPLTSNEGITGTWSPASIDTSIVGTTAYTFTADAGQPCTANVTINVTINAPVVPNFTAQLTICAGDTAPVLALTSPNAVAGSWSPSVVDNTTSGNYIFTPDAGQCAVPQTINVVVNPTVTPDFAQIAPFCSGTNAPTLATTSPNGVSGTWSPSTISNTASGCYTFTPNAGQCGVPQTLCTTVNPTVTPLFDPIAPFCAGAPAPILPNPSTNGVSGTWSPATISNNAGTATYTFTPDAGGCNAMQTLQVTVNEVPAFGIQGGCQGTSYVLSVLPVNGFNVDQVNYHWTSSNGATVGGNTQSITVTSAGQYSCEVSSAESCSSTQSFTADSTSCAIQKGISANGDGLNDNFDLAGLNVKKLTIYNRYGTKVYSQNNYSNEWYGQSDKGEELSDGTYYYVIERVNETKTGWIYINREKK